MTEGHSPASSGDELADGEPQSAVSGDSPTAELDFAQELQRFLKKLDSTRKTLPLLGSVLGVNAKYKRKALEEFVAEKDIEAQENEGETTYYVPLRHARRFMSLREELDAARSAMRFVPPTFIVTLVSQYDAFLGARSSGFSCRENPIYYEPSEKKFTYADMTEFDSLTAVEDFVIEKEVESVLRCSHSEHFDWLEKKLDIRLRKGLDVWPVFIELTERRNLFVHADGVVSSQYLQVCNQAGVELDDSVKLGTRLSVLPDYFQTACDCVLEIAAKLTHVLWRKVAPEERVEADKELNEVCHDLIREEREKLALTLLTFATESIPTHSSEQARLYFLLNKAQAHKWLGETEATTALLAAEDWTAKGLQYRLAKAVLADEFTEASNLVRQIGPEGEVPKGAYGEWAIFREFRQSAEFAEAFDDVFGEPFHLEETTDAEDERELNALNETAQP